jgi:hypothetical protein
VTVHGTSTAGTVVIVLRTSTCTGYSYVPRYCMLYPKP